MTDDRTKQVTYQIDFRRIEDQLSMDQVLRRPFVDEVEDYREYKRIRQGMQESTHQAPKRTRRIGNAVITGPSDGADDALEFDGDVDPNADVDEMF